MISKNYHFKKQCSLEYKYILNLISSKSLRKKIIQEIIANIISNHYFKYNQILDYRYKYLFFNKYRD